MTRKDLIKHWQNLYNIIHTDRERVRERSHDNVNAGAVDNIHIYTDKRVIYIKYPKNGGSTLFRAIIEPKIPRNSENYICPGFNPLKFQLWLDNMTEEALDQYFIFAIVRNPYNRLISAFQYIYKDNKDLTFKDFLENNISSEYNHHWIPQSYICKGMNIFDYVGKLEENFDGHVKVLLERLGLNCNIDIPITNQSIDRKIEYDSYKRKIVNEKYKDDFLLFDYQILN